MIKFVELASASPAEKTTFKDSVQLADGRVEVAVHPHYNDDWPGDPLKRSVVSKILTDRHYTRTIKSGRPLIFFLEGRNSDPLPPLSETLGRKTSGTAYVVYTQTSDPRPVQAMHVWPALIDTMEEAQTREVLVGGRYMVKHPATDCEEGPDVELAMYARFLNTQKYQQDEMPWLKQDTVPFGCAGSVAVWFLRRDLKLNY